MRAPTFLMRKVFLQLILVSTWLLFEAALPVTCDPRDSLCSRQLSKQALSVIEKVVLPIFDKRSVPLPPGCLYQPKGSRYYDNEKRTFANSPGNWQCGYCGKGFYRETSLWRHYENKHQGDIGNSSTPCLADLCPMLRCDVLTSTLSSSLSASAASEADGKNFWDQALCKEGRMLPLMERCHDAVQTCLPHGSSNLEAIRNDLMESLCGYLTCDNYYIVHKAFIPRTYATQMWKIVLLIMVLYGYYIFVCMHMCDSMGVPRDSRTYFSNRRR